ncbi:TadE/TadG family type IV pilus assembly protein [Aureimonas jatrophae]|uniref:TadE-like protein n=1 Tax=Aureimonas jatrophae TaxID=1166073 RepID=A0A1H0EYX0_9HYPH|nr:TadE/TadG family type IV pilus assembly protein [Aureimonas jatrophae]MBB3950255.1 Flp pilus assembly pilin Flp [Aureimonas jatrophae]SDN87496.1 TadE-like protein [Aureimonas jatrophae]
MPRRAASLARALRRCPSRFARAERGVAAIEFALLFPLLLMIVAASVDISEALYARRKTIQIAANLAGFVADQNQWSGREVDDLIGAARFIIRPFPARDLAVTVSVLRVGEDGSVKVSASRAIGGEPLRAGDAPPIPVPAAIRKPDVDLVLAQVDYSLETPFSTLWPVIAVHDRFEFSQHYFARPRRSDKVTID